MKMYRFATHLESEGCALKLIISLLGSNFFLVIGFGSIKRQKKIRQRNKFAIYIR